MIEIGKVVLPGPTRNRDFSRSENEAMNANIAAAIMPGRIVGSVTRKKVCSGFAPRLRAASSDAAFAVTSEAHTRRIVHGSAIRVWAITRPWKVAAN